MKLLTLLALAVLLSVPPALWAARPAGKWQDLLEKRTFTSGKAKLPYRLLKPEHYDAKKTYPLVVFLHGAGEQGAPVN
jgi:poly(3-hydroxybutyrate) depolymerase